MHTIWQDLRYGARALLKQPGFALVAVLTLAVGIGANTAIFSVVNATLLRPFPFREPDRLMRVSLMTPPMRSRVPSDDVVWSFPKYQTFRELQEVFEDVGLYRGGTYNLTGVEQAERLRGEMVTASNLRILGVTAQVGRIFLPDDERAPGAPRIALLGNGLWQRVFGGDPKVVGQTVQLDANAYAIVGVLPERFRGLTGAAEIWIPIVTQSAEELEQRWSHSYEGIARLKPGITVQEAKSAVTLLGRRIDEAHPDRTFKGWGAKARTLDEARIDRDTRLAVLVLFAAVVFVLLIACANIANLLLARAGVRQREIAIRLALGAGRKRILRQLLTESVLLALIGAVAGLVFAQWGVTALNSINPVGGGTMFRRVPGLMLIGLSSIRLDSTALLFTLAAALGTGILFGLAPAWKAAGGHWSVRTELEATASRQRVTGSVLVVAEIALALVLLVASGLMIKSFGRLLATHSGIDASNLLTLRINLTGAQYQGQASVAFFEQLQERLAALPGVQSVGVTDCPPLAGGCSGTLIWFRDRPEVPRGSEPIVGVHWVLGDYFKTIRAPLERGRWFTPQDRQGSPKVVLVSETAARRFWPAEDPIGKPIGVGQGGFGDRAEVIGVVGDVRFGGLEEPPQPDVYISYRQSPRGSALVFLRTTGNPTALAASVRNEIRNLSKDLPLYDIKSMEERIGESTAKMRFSTTLLGAFASIAMILAAVGIYGVMSYAVTQRTREIGIRIALGAQPADVIRLVVRRGMLLALAGVVLGLGAALAATRILATLLYQVTPGDPATYAIFAAVLGGVALLASYLPARRATRVDPLVALRAE